MQENKEAALQSLLRQAEKRETSTDELYMRRCIQLALNGEAGAKPNPMVGAVLVADGRIIGEGWHRCFGKAHAEVNAFASVRAEDEGLLHRSTLYVSLEPCSHQGKTPPCADLIIAKGVKKVVVGCLDPFPEVSGRGVAKLQQAGIEVTVGVLEAECRFLNRFFITSNTLHRPYIILKWAQTLDGFIDKDGNATAISTPFTQMLVHKLRATCDAILVGNTTEKRERPQLNVRHWVGKSPMKCVLTGELSLDELLASLHQKGVQSLMVEGGLRTHRSFLDAQLWDEIHLETAAFTVGRGTPAPQLPPDVRMIEHRRFGENSLYVFVKHTS